MDYGEDKSEKTGNVFVLFCSVFPILCINNIQLYIPCLVCLRKVYKNAVLCYHDSDGDILYKKSH